VNLICTEQHVNKLLSEADADVVCQPGLGWMELNETLQSEGIEFLFVRLNTQICSSQQRHPTFLPRTTATLANTLRVYAHN
jgi:hypothetical protein